MMLPLVLAVALTQAPTPQAPTLPPAAIPVTEAAALTQYWAALAEGRYDDAVQALAGLLSRHPNHIGFLSVAVEATIAQSGAHAGLTLYEEWQAGRAVEEPGVLRRVARAVLYEWGRQVANGSVRSEALLALARDGEPDALQVLADMAAQADEGGLRAGVRLQWPQAIADVATRIRATTGLRLRDINLLAESGSQQAVPVLVELLGDPQPENRSAAASALGRIGGAAAENALVPALQDEHGLVRMNVAAALFQMGNFAGAGLLHDMAANESASIRLSAAQMLASQPDQGWQALVRSLLDDPDPQIRLEAGRLIAPHDPGAARAVLEPLAFDPNIAIREEAELVRSELPISTFPELRALMRGGSPLARVRAASRVLALTRR